MDNTTWHDQRPTHESKPLAVENAFNAMETAWDNYLATCDDGRPQEDIEEMRKTAEILEKHYNDVYNEFSLGALVPQIWQLEEHDALEYGRAAMTEEGQP